MTRTRILIISAAAVVVALVALIAFGVFKTNGAVRAGIAAAEFTEQLQHVSTTADAEEVKAAINQYYAPYITPELLTEWLADPASAPGRDTSSPWPDRLFIKSITEQGKSFLINADVLYVTSKEVESPEDDAAGVMVVTILVVPTDDGYRIAAFEELFGENLGDE